MPMVSCYNPNCVHNDRSVTNGCNNDAVIGGICIKACIEILGALKLCTDFDDGMPES